MYGMRPHQTIRNLLLHPKDKQELTDRAEIVYKILCKNCKKKSIIIWVNRGSKFGVRLGEHKKYCEHSHRANPSTRYLHENNLKIPIRKVR